jgi:predicted nucleic acid-binding protein
VNWLLDTNVVSELNAKRPDSKVVEWIDAQSDDTLYLSSITFAELQRGVILLPNSPRRRSMFAWIRSDLVARFAGRILPVDEKVALIWGNLVAAQQMKGRTLPVLDSLIAATASAHQLTLATRNLADMERLGVDLFNPWTDTFL